MPAASRYLCAPAAPKRHERTKRRDLQSVFLDFAFVLTYNVAGAGEYPETTVTYYERRTSKVSMNAYDSA